MGAVHETPVMLRPTNPTKPLDIKFEINEPKISRNKRPDKTLADKPNPNEVART